MSFWKTDPLYRAIFEEVRALWHELPGADGPELLRIEMRSWIDLDHQRPDRASEVWLLDSHGLRVVPMLRKETHEYGPEVGGYSRFGLVQFRADRASGRVDLAFRLGPAICGEIFYEVEGEGDELHLWAHSGPLSV